jgi:hypothetical protein
MERVNFPVQNSLSKSNPLAKDAHFTSWADLTASAPVVARIAKCAKYQAITDFFSVIQWWSLVEWKDYKIPDQLQIVTAAFKKMYCMHVDFVEVKIQCGDDSERLPELSKCFHSYLVLS